MRKGNGGVIGPEHGAVTSIGKGVWSLSEQQQSQGKNWWPRLPGAPTSVSGTVLSAGSVSVSFTAPSDTGVPSTITSYTVTSSPGGFTATGSSSPITVSGLGSGPYTFTVTATNDVGTGPASSPSASVAMNLIRITGGTTVDYNGYRIHRLTSSQSITVDQSVGSVALELFIIGGGGGGNSGSSSGPGGGAGGAYWRTNQPLPSVGTYSAVIGAGGTGAVAGATGPGRGGDSSVFGITAAGGAGAGNSGWTLLGAAAGVWTSAQVTLNDGGCGAGTYNGGDIATHPRDGITTDIGRTVYNSTGSTTAGSDQTYYYGYPSGNGDSSNGGGGGGIGARGADATGIGGVGAAGGAGMSFNWVGSTEWMGGGGGGASSVSGGAGGSGVGGNAGGSTTAGGNGVANTGSGGGGSGSGTSGSGSAGVIIIKYQL